MGFSLVKKLSIIYPLSNTKWYEIQRKEVIMYQSSMKKFIPMFLLGMIIFVFSSPLQTQTQNLENHYFLDVAVNTRAGGIPTIWVGQVINLKNGAAVSHVDQATPSIQ
jgi:hypothetical protein